MRNLLTIATFGLIFISSSNGLSALPQKAIEKPTHQSPSSMGRPVYIAQSTAGVDVTVYVKGDCRLCKEQLQELDKGGINYVLKDVDDPKSYQDMATQISGYHGDTQKARETIQDVETGGWFPLVFIDSSIYTGYTYGNSAAKSTISTLTEIARRQGKNPPVENNNSPSDNSPPQQPPEQNSSSPERSNNATACNLGNGLKIHESGHVVWLKIDQPMNWKRLGDSESVKKLIKDKIYSCFEDEFDWIFLLGNHDKPAGTANASRYVSARDYGSSGKLQSVLRIPGRSYINNGPSLHEILHFFPFPDKLPRWTGEYVRDQSDQQRTTAAGEPLNVRTYFGKQVTDRNESHWHVSRLRGQLGGIAPQWETTSDAVCSIYCEAGGGDFFVQPPEKNPDGSLSDNPAGWTNNGGNAVPYADLELYLMGLEDRPPSLTVYQDVKKVLQYGRFDRSGLSYYYQIQGTQKTYSGAEIAAMLGDDKPVYKPNKEFRALAILLDHEEPTDAEFDEVAINIEWLGYAGPDDKFNGKGPDTSLYNFYEATKGRGKLITDIRDALK